jgi:hypothetical protein
MDRFDCYANLNELISDTARKINKSYFRLNINIENGSSVYDKVTMYDENGNVNTPTREVWDTAMIEVVKTLIRDTRDRKLLGTDKYALPDYPHTSEEKRQEWLAYRQSLRDFMSTIAFEIPEDGIIEYDIVTWPEEPTP